MSEAKYVVGIDLGTSNCALAYADLQEVAQQERPLIRQLEVLQLIAPADPQERPLLPSALYLPADFELDAEQLQLPWHSEPTAEVVGEAARKLGGKTPVRLIESAKSWLCHGGVNRTHAILPWHAPDEVPKRSPVEVSAAFLSHMAHAWDQEHSETPLADQIVIITVPASFDEVARRLTLEAANKAGLPDVTLIEEPLAAFYAFVARTGGTTATTGLEGGQRVLVADVGGGTTDFTLVEVIAPQQAGGALAFERTAVGDHLLLGGDNMDLALAHAVEPRLSGKAKLDAEGWAQLKLECRIAKEALFTHLERDEIPVTVAGRGSKLVGGTRRAALTRALLEEVVVGGYYPELPKGTAAFPVRGQRSGFQEYGLPYAQDAGITRHLAAFLARHAEEGEAFAPVEAILFNGGALKPPVVRDRVCSVLGQWMRQTQGSDTADPRPLIYDEGNDVLELAVARGAAYFGLVRRGLGNRVGGGSPRAFFLGLGGEDVAQNQLRVLCVAPRGMQDGQQVEVHDREFQLMTNRPVEFPLYATTSPSKDAVGAVLDVPEDSLDALPPLQTVVKFGKHAAGTQVPVRIQARRSELGTLELSCLSRMSGARFSLEFDLRARGSAEELTPASAFSDAVGRAPPEVGEVEPERLDAAKRRIDKTFAIDSPRPDPDKLMKGLETDLDLKRDSFPLSALRALAEHLVELADRRPLSPALEARWMNVMGFCLRPGFGVPMDDWRVRQLWKIHAKGILHPAHDPCELNWWILWRRVAGGLSRGHQEDLSGRLFPLINPALFKRAKRKPPRAKTQEAAEMWRAAASLEQLSAKARAQLGAALLEMIEQRKAPKAALWCLGRIGARGLLYGPRESTVRASVAADWAERLMKVERLPKDEHPAACLMSLCRRTGDRQFDLQDSVATEVASYLTERGLPEDQLRPLFEVVQVDSQAQGQAFGDSLPIGLSL